MNCGRCIINKHRKLLLPGLLLSAAVATWEHFVDDVRQGRRQEGSDGGGDRALQTQLKRAAATLTVVLHLFQFTVYVCWRSYLQPPFPLPHLSLLLPLLHPCFILLFVRRVAAQSQFFCLLTAFWGLSHVFFALLFLPLAFEICLPHGNLALFGREK